MPILLSQLLQQIENQQDSNILSIEQANQLFNSFVLTSVQKEQSFLLQGQQRNIVVDGREEIIEGDVNIVIRPRHAHLTTDLSTLSDNELLSAIALNTFSNDTFNSGSMTELRQSIKQYHYNTETNQFEGKENNKKVMRKPHTGMPSIETPSADKQDVIRQLLGKDKNRGLYWLNSDNNSVSISPFIDGMSLQKMISRGEHKELLKKNPLEIQKWVILLFIQLACLHEQGYVHQDVKPDNVMNSKGKISLVDFDFLYSMKELLSANKGTPQYMPYSILDELSNRKTANPYQDIYGALIIASLLLQPNFFPTFNNFATRIANHLSTNQQEGIWIEYMKKLEASLVQAARGVKHSWFNIVIYNALCNKNSTALEIIANFLATDTNVMLYFSGLIVQNNQEQVELNSHIDLYYKKYPELYELKRKKLAEYIAACLVGKSTYSYDDFIKQFGTVNQLDIDLFEKITAELSSSSNEELNHGLHVAIKYLALNGFKNNELDLLKGKIVEILIKQLLAEETIIASSTVVYAAFFLTHGNHDQAEELNKLFDSYISYINFGGRPEFRAGYEAIISVLLTSLKGEQPYQHQEAIKQITAIFEAAKPKKLSYAERRKQALAEQRTPPSSMHSPGPMFFKSAEPTVPQVNELQPGVQKKPVSPIRSQS